MARREKPRQFLPVSREDMLARDWYWYDFLFITADAYVDPPLLWGGGDLPGAGRRGLPGVYAPSARLAQRGRFCPVRQAPAGCSSPGATWIPWWPTIPRRKSAAARTCTPPGGRAGLRPDRATIVYANRVREAFGHIPLIIGGLEASLRRFAHYDYWEDKVRRSILFDAQADLISYGMGERSTLEIAQALKRGCRWGRFEM